MDHENNWKCCKIVEQKETGEIILHQNNLEALIDFWSKIRRKDDPIILVSFIGPQSCGKSFFTNLYIEYIRMHGSLSWTKRIKREGLKGFSYGVEPNIITAEQLFPEKNVDAVYFYPELMKLNIDQREDFMCILHVHHGKGKNRNKEIDIALDVLLAMISSPLVNIIWNDKNTWSDINQLVTDPRYLPIKDHLTGNVLHLLRGEGTRENKSVIHLEESASLHDNAGLVKLSYQQYSAVNNLMKAISISQSLKQAQATFTLSNILGLFKEKIKIINVCNGFDTPLSTQIPEHTLVNKPKRKTKSVDEYNPENKELEQENDKMPKDMEDKIKSFFSSQFSEQAKPEVDHWINNVLINQNFVPIHNEFDSFLHHFNEQNVSRILYEAKAEFQKNQKLINKEIMECLQNFYMIMNTQLEDVPHFSGNALRKALNGTLTLVTSDLKFPESKERIMKASRNMFKFYYEKNSSYETQKSVITQSEAFRDDVVCKANSKKRYEDSKTAFPSGMKSKEQQRKENEALKEKAKKLNKCLKEKHEVELEGYIELGADDLQSYHNDHVKDLLERYEDETPYPKDTPEYGVYQDILKDKLKIAFNAAKSKQRQNKLKKEATVTSGIKSALEKYERQLQDFIEDDEDLAEIVSETQLVRKHEEIKKEILDWLKSKVGHKSFNEIAEKTEQKIGEILDKYKSKATQNQNTAAYKSLNMISKYKSEYTKTMRNAAKTAKDQKTLQKEHERVADDLTRRFESMNPVKTIPSIFREHLAELKRTFEDAYSEAQEILKISQKNAETSSKLAISQVRQFYCLEMDKHRTNNEQTFKRDLYEFHAKTCDVAMKKFPGLKQAELKESVKLAFQKYQDEEERNKIGKNRAYAGAESGMFGRGFGDTKSQDYMTPPFGERSIFDRKLDEMKCSPFVFPDNLSSDERRFTSIHSASSQAIMNQVKCTRSPVGKHHLNLNPVCSTNLVNNTFEQDTLWPERPLNKTNQEDLHVLFQISLQKIGTTTMSLLLKRNDKDPISTQFHPGVVGILLDGKWVCGDDVKECNQRGNVQKSWLFEDIFKLYDFNDKVVFNNAQIHITLPLLLAIFFEIMKQKTEEEHDGNVSAATISVPFWFSSYQRTQIVEAGSIAGFSNVQLINENMASAYYAFTRGLWAPSKNLVVISENSNKLDISIYSRDQQSNTIYMIGHSGDYEVTEPSKYLNSFVNYGTGTLTYVFNNQQETGIQEKTVERLYKLWELARSRVQTHLNLRNTTILICCESDRWRDLLLKFATMITSSENISIRNDSPLLGLESFVHASSLRMSPFRIGSKEPLFRDAIPFNVIFSPVSDLHYKTMPLMKLRSSLQGLLVIDRNSTFSRSETSNFYFELPKSVFIFNFIEDDVSSQIFGKFRLKPPLSSSFNIRVTLERNKNGIFKLTAVDYTENYSHAHFWGARRKPLPDNYYEWQPCKSSEETLATYRSIIDYISLQTNSYSKNG